jgi:hypothetical protein
LPHPAHGRERAVGGTVGGEPDCWDGALLWVGELPQGSRRTAARPRRARTADSSIE